MKHAPKNPMRHRLIFFEGLDKSGKSTLCRRARFESGHEALMFDRGFVGRRVFHRFRNETEFPIMDWNCLESDLIVRDNYAIVYLRVEPKISYKRILAAGEKPEFTLAELEYQHAIFEKEIELLQAIVPLVPILIVDTGVETERESLKKILAWVKGGEEWI